jgi:NitT/TauT family transport system permease protein
VGTRENEHRNQQRPRLWPHVAFWLVVVALAAGFEMLVRERVVSPAAYAAPTETIRRLVTLFTQDGFAADVWITARRALLSVLIGFPLGVGLAIGLYTLGRARGSGEMALDFIRSAPITALIPLLIALTGIGELSKVSIGAFSAMLVTAITVWVGIKHGLRRFSLLMHLYRPTFGKRVSLVILPYTLPSMLAALKLAVSSALVLVVVAEMFLGSRGGIGKVINDRTYGDDRAAQFAAVAAAGLLGYFLNVVFDGVQRVVLHTLGEPGGGAAGPASV